MDDFQSQQPPPYQETKSGVATMLAWIQVRLAKLYSTAGDELLRGHRDYVVLYTAIFNCLTPVKVDFATSYARDLYRSLEGVIRHHCQGLRALVFVQSLPLDEHNLRKTIEACVSEWETFIRKAKLVTDLMKPLTQYRNSSESTVSAKGLCSLSDLHKTIWNQEMLNLPVGSSQIESGAQRLTSAAKTLREHNSSEDETEKLIALLANSAVSLGHEMQADLECRRLPGIPYRPSGRPLTQAHWCDGQEQLESA